MPLAFVSPNLTRKILEGRQPIDLTADSLIKRADLPLDWQDQKEVLDLRRI